MAKPGESDGGSVDEAFRGVALALEDDGRGAGCVAGGVAGVLEGEVRV